MIVDSHAHYIQPPSADRPYAGPATVVPTSVDELAEAAALAGVDRVIQVTPSTMGYDNRYSFEGARARPDRIAGVFGRFDPQAPEVERRLREYWADPLALGVRQTMFGEGTQRWLQDRVLDPFLRAAAALDMPVALFAPFQVQAVLETVDRHPDVRFLVDHTLIRHEPGQTTRSAYRHWSELLVLASRPNVWTKVSHFPEAALGEEPYPFPTARERFRQLFEHVGPGRLVWGSNYPPVRRACTYRQALGFVQEACDFLDGADRREILGGTWMTHFSRKTPPA